MAPGEVPGSTKEDALHSSTVIEAPLRTNSIPNFEETCPLDANNDVFYIRKRLAVLGAHHSGKSALACQCAHGMFNPRYVPTFEDTYIWRTIIDHVPYEVTIIDTEGQDGHSFFGSHFTVGVDGYVLVYSVCDSTSFEAVKTINKNLMRILSVSKPVGCQEVPRVLVGTMVDDLESRCVPYDIVAEYAAQLGIPYIETSVVGKLNVPEAFAEVVRVIVANWRRSHILSNDETIANLISSYDNTFPNNPRIRVPSQSTLATPTTNSITKNEHDQRESSSAPDNANQPHKVPTPAALNSTPSDVPAAAPSSEPTTTTVPSPLTNGDSNPSSRSSSCFVQ